MKKNNIKNIIYKRFPSYNFKKIIIFHNPCECNYMYIEKLNPDHIGIIWGRRKKNCNKGNNFIRIGKVYFELILLSSALSIAGWIDMLTGYIYNILLNIGLYSIIISLAVSTIYWFSSIQVIKKCCISFSY